jgi:hypothetical protein
MSVFRSVEVCGMELAVISSLGCVYAAADRDGAIYAYQDYPIPDRRNGVWLSAYYRTMLVPANMFNMKRGQWLNTLTIISNKVIDI